MNIHIHHHPHPEDKAPSWARELHRMLSLILTKQEKLMSALDDLTAALADLATALTANTAEIDLLLTKIVTPGTSDADVEAAVTQIRALTAANVAEVAK